MFLVSKLKIKMSEQNNSGLVSVKTWKRHIAFLLDAFPVGIPLYLVVLLAGEEITNTWIGALIGFASFLFYFTYFPHRFGTTLGQWILGIKIIDESSKSNPPIVKLLLREFLFLTTMTGIGYLYFLAKGYYWDRVSGIFAVENSKELGSRSGI